jgi:hypothetical protein
MLKEEQEQPAGCKTYREAEKIQRAVKLIPGKVPDGDFKMIVKHINPICIFTH